MRGEYVDDELERQLHDGFTGRGDLLDELDRLVVRDTADRCVVLKGGTGLGKTAIVTRWLIRREASHDPVFHHFIRRQRGDRAEPWLIAGALAAQIEKRFPQLRDPFARPEARLSQLVTRAVRELAPHRRRLVLVIDGLGERPAGSDLREVLACLPRAQPGGLRLVLAGRLRDPERDLEGRYGQVVALDLDDPGFAADNEATVRAYWTREAGALALDAGLAEHAVRCARGNMLHAALLRKHLARLPQPEHCSDAIPRDLPALLAKLWQRVEGAPAALRALEILCAAREPLSLEQIGRVAGWTDPGDLRAVANLARELVVEIRRDDRTTVYGIFHDAVRSFAIERLGPIAIRGQHRELADKLATWPAPRDPATRRYALRYAVGHRIAAGDCRAVHALASDLAFLEAKCSELGIDEAELDVRRSADACLAAGQMTLHADLDRLVRSIASESSSLPRDAGPDAAPLWGRVRKGQPAAEQAAPAPAPAPASAPGSAAPPEVGRTALLRGRPGVLSALIGRAAAGALDPAAVSAPAGATATGRTLSQPGRPAQLAALVGRGGGVTACAVTPDSRRVVAAYADHSLKLWDLETGRVVRTMTGHTGAIASCAITPDGRWTVSASADTTLRVWDLPTGDLLATFEGHTDAVESCAISPDGRWVVSASADTTLKVWDLETGDLLATFEGHTGSVESCAVSPDGGWVVSASADTTLKMWDLRTGELVATFKGHTDAVADCAVTVGGRHVVSGSADHTLRVWDVGTGRVTTTLRGHAGPIAGCAVGPDRHSVYSASSDSTLRIWDVDTGRVVASLEGHTRPVTCCAVTPDGRRLISGSADHTLRVWALDGQTTTRRGGIRQPVMDTLSPPGDAVAQRARKPAGGKQLILFLAAHCKDSHRKVLQEECVAIDRELAMARHGNDFEFRCKSALTVDEVARHLIELDPAIVHFRGQGRSDAPDVTPGARPTTAPTTDSGIYLRDERGGVQLVTGRALKMLIEASAPSARAVVLNACYSDDHASELCQVVECVIGMTRDHDRAALSFAAAFYRALGNRRSVGQAVAHAVATLAAKQVPDDCVPRCRTRHWADPHEIFLGADRAET